MQTKDWYLTDLETETELDDIQYSIVIGHVQDAIKLLSFVGEFPLDTIAAAHAQDATRHAQYALTQLLAKG